MRNTASSKSAVLADLQFELLQCFCCCFEITRFLRRNFSSSLSWDWETKFRVSSSFDKVFKNLSRKCRVLKSVLRRVEMKLFRRFSTSFFRASSQIFSEKGCWHSETTTHQIRIKSYILKSQNNFTFMIGVCSTRVSAENLPKFSIQKVSLSLKIHMLG